MPAFTVWLIRAILQAEKLGDAYYGTVFGLWWAHSLQDVLLTTAIGVEGVSNKIVTRYCDAAGCGLGVCCVIEDQMEQKRWRECSDGSMCALLVL